MNQVVFRYFVRTTMGIILVAGLLPLTSRSGILFSDSFARTTLPGNDLDADDRKSSWWSASVREDASR